MLLRLLYELVSCAILSQASFELLLSVVFDPHSLLSCTESPALDCI